MPERPESKTMKNRRILLVFGAFLLAVVLSLIVRLLDVRKVQDCQDSSDAASRSDG